MKLYGRACVFIVCFMYWSWLLCSFPTHWERVRQSVVQAARLKTPLKADQTKWRQFCGLQAPLAFGHIFAACYEMSFCLLYNFKLPEEGLVFVHTLRLTRSTLMHQTPTLQNKHSAVVRPAVKDESFFDLNPCVWSDSVVGPSSQSKQSRTKHKLSVFQLL